MFAATPCPSFSNARRPLIRTREHIYSLPGLQKLVLSLVRNANLVAERTQVFTDTCITCNIPGGDENPSASLLLHLPFRVRASSESRVRGYILDFCVFGTSCRKRTKVRLWCCSELNTKTALCTGHGFCSFSGKQHVPLHGRIMQASISPKLPSCGCLLALVDHDTSNKS